MNDETIERDIKKERYEYIAHQINREDTLINHRLTWILTLNGFLFTALGLLGSRDGTTTDIAVFLHWALPLTGIMVTVAGTCGVLAAHLQMVYLTNEWDDLNDSRWVRPFGSKKLSFWLGTVPTYLPSVILFVVWVGLFIKWEI